MFYPEKEYRSSLAIKACINSRSGDDFIQADDFRANGISMFRYDSLIKDSCVASDKHLEQ